MRATEYDFSVNVFGCLIFQVKCVGSYGNLLGFSAAMFLLS